MVKSALQVTEQANQASSLELKPWFGRKVLREDLAMSYKTLVQRHPNTNSDLNRVVRQQWAIEYRSQLKAGKTIINVDETWLNQTDFRRHAWGKRGQRLAVLAKKTSIRISMILAFDSQGAVYFSVSD